MPFVEPIKRHRERIVFSNGFGRLYNDEVVAPSGEDGSYLRWQWQYPGVVCIPTHGGRIALAKMYRYPIDGVSLELPRGGRNSDEDPITAAERELREEFGLVAIRSRLLGTLYPDTGLIETPASIVTCHVADEEPDAVALEVFESAQRFYWYTIGDVASLVRTGSLRCGITLASLALAYLQSGDPGVL